MHVSWSSRCLISMLLLVLFFLGGCVTSTTSTVPGVSFESRPRDFPITIYAKETPDGMTGVEHINALRHGGTELGHVFVNGAEAASWNAVLTEAKRKARKMGGDAIVVEQWGYQPVTGYAYSGGMAIPVTSSAKALSGRVIRLK